MSNTTDRELLELAAKAAEIEINWFKWERLTGQWNPLTDDGDAFRLAVKLRILVDPRTQMKSATLLSTYSHHEAHSDEFAATRRAIVRAAAEIGRQMP